MSDNASPTEDSPQARAAAAAAAAPKPRRSAWWWVLNIGIFFTALAVVASWGARMSWVFDLACHFRVQYAMVLTVAAVLLLVGRWFKWGLVVAVLAGTQIWALAPFYLAAPDVPHAEVSQRLAASAAAMEKQQPSPANDPQGVPAIAVMPLPAAIEPVPGRTANWVRIMSVNVLTSNTEYRRLLELVKQERPDVIFVMECDDAWIEALRDLPAEYTFREEEPRQGNFGLALYSRYPFFAEMLELGSDGFPVIVANCNTAGGSFTLVGAHTIPPMHAETSQFRNEQLEYLARIVQGRQTSSEGSSLDSISAGPSAELPPLVVVGDWNITSWSPHFIDFVEEVGLRDTRRGLGVQTTWPATLPAPLRIPIDHALVSPEIEVLDRRVGPAVGSDHFPVILDILLPELPAADDSDAAGSVGGSDVDSLDLPLD